ncbi:MAG: hypothetical protein LBH44_01935 [Treponema sp.]|jgi:hypothetical protein|nr:hypothetical protein [Treponema sp.]
MGKLNSPKKKNDTRKKDEKAKTLANVGIASAATEVVQRYGSAVKEHLVIYDGQDNEAGKTLKKSLKSISKQKINPDYEYQNLKQQAGFAAEVKETARENAERIINGDKTRITRTDDIGRVNDPLFDHIELDSKGKVIAGSGSQMKFVGKNPKEALNKLASKKFEKYLDADVEIEVPSNYYDGIKTETQAKIKDLQQQVKTLKSQGNNEAAKQCQDKLEKYKKIDKKLQKSKTSTNDAMEARKAPEVSTVKDIAKISHKAGLEQAKWGAGIGGGLSLVKNVVSVAKGDIEPDEAAISVVKDTGTGAVVSYSNAFAGSVIKGGMQNAKNGTIRALAKTNIAATIVTATVETGKTLGKYIKGEIDGVECLTELGEKGTGMLSSAMFAVVGQAVIPIPVIGGMIGGMVGYALSSACYNELVSALQEAKLAREERIRIEKECEEAIAMIRQYRLEMEQLVSKYLVDHIETFHIAFDGIKDALEIGDIDEFITSTNKITRKLGKTPPFETFNEFDTLMASNMAIKL